MQLFKLFGTIMVDNDKANKSIHATTEKANKAKEKIGNALKTIGKVGAVATTAFATAIGVLTKNAIENYAQYEQLLGGIETLFKGSSKQLVEYANKAYLTAGMSANKYMDTVTSFSASLIQSLNGDTEKAVEVSNMAITDMSDNANKMGTSIELIQNAYQGFAKQNYSMLDNLKLGYGGTKKEMERLLADAERFSGIKYDINSLNDVYQAIHVVQTEMGITGTTAKESMQTIEGSFNALKASWENLVTGFADPNQDLGLLLKNTIDIGMTAFSNLGTRIAETIPRILSAVGEVGAELATKFGSFTSQLINDLPQYIQSFSSVFRSCIDEVSKHIPKWMKSIFNGIVSFIQNNIGVLIQEGLSIVKSLATAIHDGLPIVIENGANALKAFLQGIMDNIPTMIQQVPQIITTLANTISNAVPQLLIVGAEMIWILIEGIFSAIPDLLANIPYIFESIIAVWNAINWLSLGQQLINGIWNGITSVFSAFQDNIKLSFGDIGNLISNIFTGLKNSAKDIWKSMFDNIGNIINFFKTLADNLFKAIVSSVVNKFDELWKTATNIWKGIKDSISNAIKGACDFVGQTVTSVKDKVKSVFDGLKGIAETAWNGIKTAITNPIETAKNTVKSVIDAMKGFFNFNWELPKIKLPHFSVTGSANPLDWFTQGIPKISVEWYKKGAILEKPTMFGFNPYTNSAMVGGEAGKEAVAPISELMGYVRTAVAESYNENGLSKKIDVLIDILLEYLPILTNKNLVLDSGALVGELAPLMDKALGDIKDWKG